MGALGSETLNITNDAVKYAKIISSAIEDAVQRKRAFASIVALDTFADFLLTKGVKVNISKNLFKIAPINAEFEISDIYHNGWKIDVRVVGDDDILTIPQKHFKAGITADFYVAIKVDKEFGNAVVLGYVDSSVVNKKSKDELYYLVNIVDLSSSEELVGKLKTINESFVEDANHNIFEKFYLGYVDNEIDEKAKKRLIKHLVNCQQCREEFVEFFDFETIVVNSKKYPGIFEDNTLAVIGGVIANDEKYKGKETVIDISDNQDDGNIIDDLFSKTTIAPVMLAGGVVNLGITPSITPKIDINAGSDPLGFDENSKIDDLLGIEPEALNEVESEFIFNEDQDGLFNGDDNDDVPPDSAKDSASEDELTEALNSEDNDFLKEYDFLNLDDEQENLIKDEGAESLIDESMESKLDESSELKEDSALEDSSEILEEENIIENDLLSDVVETNFDSLNEDASVTDADESFFNDNFQEIKVSSLESDRLEESLADEFDFNSPEEIVKENETLQDEYQENVEENKIVEETIESAFLSSDEVAEDVSDEILDTDLDEIFDSPPAVEPETESESFLEVASSPFDDVAEDKMLDGFISSPAPDFNISQESFISMSQNEILLTEDDKYEQTEDSMTSDGEGLKVLFNENEAVVADEALEGFEDVNANASGVKNKKMAMLASAVIGCVLLATILGVSLFVHNKNKEAETVNDQIMAQAQNQLIPPPSQVNSVNPTAPNAEDILKSPTANTPKDMNKVMTNVFSDTPSSVTVTKIAWEVPMSLARDTVFAKFLQITGQNLQLNLKSDLVNATEFAYNDKINVLITLASDSKLKDVKVLNSSGSNQIDQLVLQSIKETLQYINIPAITTSNQGAGNAPSQAAKPNNADKNKIYNLKLVINF